MINYYKDIIRLAAPSQDRIEMSLMLNTLSHSLGENPNILEIGVDRGGSIRLWQYEFRPNILIGIDAVNNARGIEDWHFIEGDSHSEEVKLQVMQLLESSGKKMTENSTLVNVLDFVWIDGDHTYEGVKKDYELYRPLVKDGGVMGFHDIKLDNKETNPEVRVCDFWKELETSGDYKRLMEIHNAELGGTGTGLIWV